MPKLVLKFTPASIVSKLTTFFSFFHSDPGSVRPGGHIDGPSGPAGLSTAGRVEALLPGKQFESGARSAGPRGGPRWRCAHALSLVLRPRHGHGRESDKLGDERQRVRG